MDLVARRRRDATADDRQWGVAFLLHGHHVSPADDDPRCIVCCVFPGHHLSNSAGTSRARHRRAIVRWNSKTPHLAFSAGGACPTAPETGGSDRTLPSTPSPAGPCTHLESCIHRHR